MGCGCSGRASLKRRHSAAGYTHFVDARELVLTLVQRPYQVFVGRGESFNYTMAAS